MKLKNKLVTKYRIRIRTRSHKINSWRYMVTSTHEPCLPAIPEAFTNYKTLVKFYSIMVIKEGVTPVG